jgi:hypothetical protein
MKAKDENDNNLWTVIGLIAIFTTAIIAVLVTSYFTTH